MGFCLMAAMIIPPAFMPRGIYFLSFRLSVRMFVRFSVTLTKITLTFYVKVSQMGISQQPPIRKHSYLAHGYLGGFTYIP